MKGFLAVIAVLVASSPALAQDRLVRGDAFGTLGWFNADKGEISPYDGWYNDSLVAEGGGSWYWTNHWKTEVTVGASTEVTSYGVVPLVEAGQSTYASSRLTSSTNRITVTQQYQFGDNAWFHPYLGLGVDGVWQRRTRRDEPVFAYDPVSRQSRQVRGAIEHPPDTEVDARLAASAGFKSYFTRRAFFRSDLRVTVARRPDEVVLRFGFGVDF